MRRSAWAVTAGLVGLALVAVWFFGLDARHAVVVVGAAGAAGIANGVLEGVDVPRAVLPRPPEPERGLADLQALEFSLASTEPGMRAVLEVHALALSVAAARPDAPRSRALDDLVATSRPPALTHRELQALGAELERIVLSPALEPIPSQEAP
ncbi:hypothetical protein [Arthrobacter sp. Ld5]|uniref:hypothetical protein n=1 Tax=Arthrobacter sp. Ld5 TaxID=649152 RepID=UPI003EBAE5F4